MHSANAHPHVLGTTEYILMAIAVIGACIGLFIAYSKYIRKGDLPPADEQMTGFHKVLYNKYYIDEIYMKVFIKPIYTLSVFFRDVVEVVLSETIYGLGKIADGLSLQGKKRKTEISDCIYSPSYLESV